MNGHKQNSHLQSLLCLYLMWMNFKFLFYPEIFHSQKNESRKTSYTTVTASRAADLWEICWSFTLKKNCAEKKLVLLQRHIDSTIELKLLQKFSLLGFSAHLHMYDFVEQKIYVRFILYNGFAFNHHLTVCRKKFFFFRARPWWSFSKIFHNLSLGFFLTSFIIAGVRTIWWFHIVWL